MRKYRIGIWKRLNNRINEIKFLNSYIGGVYMHNALEFRSAVVPYSTEWDKLNHRKITL